MAAPTASPVKPASEIGVSSTRSLPNSSTRPERTLKGVPASATSSPMMQTVLSRRISSASASRIACANVSSRSVRACLRHTRPRPLRRRVGYGAAIGEVDRLLHLRLQAPPALEPAPRIGEILLDQPLPKIRDRIPLRLPLLFFLLGAVIFAIDVAHVMSVIAIGIAEQKSGTVAVAGAIHQALRNAVHSAHVLPIHACGIQSEGRRPHQNISGRGLRVMRVFGVEIVLADVDHRKLEELRRDSSLRTARPGRARLRRRNIPPPGHCPAAAPKTPRRSQCPRCRRRSRSLPDCRSPGPQCAWNRLCLCSTRPFCPAVRRTFDRETAPFAKQCP